MRCKTRESPALDVIELLRQKVADVRYHDPYVLSIRHNGFEMAGEADLDAALRLGFPLPLVGDSLWS
jgi:UDP-N-acetyl-D-mannosaminuronate dehydrogenase